MGKIGVKTPKGASPPRKFSRIPPENPGVQAVLRRHGMVPSLAEMEWWARQGLGFPNKINSLGRPTPQNRALFLKDNFARCPTCPTLPEADNPLLDAWLASGDPGAAGDLVEPGETS